MQRELRDDLRYRDKNAVPSRCVRLVEQLIGGAQYFFGGGAIVRKGRDAHRKCHRLQELPLVPHLDFSGYSSDRIQTSLIFLSIVLITASISPLNTCFAMLRV